MQFDSSYITTAGSELFARATASTSGGESSPIIWGTVYTSSTDMRNSTPDEMRALTEIPESARSSSGSVIRASHDIVDGNHVAKLECEVRNETYSGMAYAIGVYAKLQGDSNEVLAAVAKVDANGSDPDNVPTTGDYWATIDFLLTVRDNQLNIIEAPASYYASATSLQDLANRVVTTHVPSSATQGEAQNVYGVKTFKNNTEHSGHVLPTANNLNIGENTTNGRWNAVYATTFNGTTFTGHSTSSTSLRYDSTNVLTATSTTQTTAYSSIIPNTGSGTSSSYALGDQNHRWQNLYTDKIQFKDYDSSTDTSVSAQFYITSGSGSDYDYSRNGISVNGNLHPASDSSYSLGNKINQWKSVYAEAVHAWGNSKNRGLVLCDGNYEHLSYCSITGFEYSSTVARMTMHFVNAANDIDYTITSEGPNTANTSSTAATLKTIPMTSGTWTLGSSAKKLGNIYTTAVYGDLCNEFTISNSSYTGTVSLKNITGTDLIWTFDRAITPNSDYYWSLGYYSSTSSLCRRWNYLYCKYIGNSSSRVTTAYIDTLYIGSTLLSNYIKNTTVTNATNATSATTASSLSLSGANDYTKINFGFTDRPSADLSVRASAFNDSSVTYSYYFKTNNNVGVSLDVGIESSAFYMYPIGVYGQTAVTSKNLGKSGNRWSNFYCDNIYCDNLYCDSLSGSKSAIADVVGNASRNIGSIVLAALYYSSTSTQANASFPEEVSGANLYHASIRCDDTKSLPSSLSYYDDDIVIYPVALGGTWRIMNFHPSISYASTGKRFYLVLAVKVAD